MGNSRVATRHERWRAVFVSDVHLGTRDAKAGLLLQFLRTLETDTLYLVGDIVDCWALKRSYYWPPAHQAVVDLILERARQGLRVVYVPGNHDELFRGLCGTARDALEIHRECVHVTADGRRLLVLHGDEFDGAVPASRSLAFVGLALYDVTLRVNAAYNWWRLRIRKPYWSLSDWLKQQVPNARRYIERFEQVAAAEARRRGYDGIVCGHIHRAQLRDIGGVAYANDGDWVESCTSLAEDADGRLHLLRPAGIAAGPADLDVAPIALGHAVDRAA